MYVLRSNAGAPRRFRPGARRSGFWILAMFVAIAACGGSDGPTGTNGDDDDDDDPTPSASALLIDAQHDEWGVAQVEVTITGPGGETTTASTDQDGAIDFDDLDDGTWTVEISPPSWFDLASGQSAEREFDLDGSERQVSIQLAPVVAQETVEIETTAGLSFSNDDLVVAPGTRVRWFNESELLHTVTPEGHTAWTEGTLQGAGYDFEVVFNNPGEYPYFCSPHRAQGMTGEVTVES